VLVASAVIRVIAVIVHGPGEVARYRDGLARGQRAAWHVTRSYPIRHFIGFCSISGRLGSLVQADYCLASDMLCKLIGAYRRERPWIKAVGFHWHPWDEVGMAARPETKNVLQSKSELTLMPLAEGLAHLVRELSAGAPQREVLIT
jgi:hypothetical protein